MATHRTNRMIVTLRTQRVRTLEQARRAAEGYEPVDFALELIRRTLVWLDCAAPGKADKGTVKAYLAKMTGHAGAARPADETAPLDGAHPRPSQRRAAPLHEALHRGRYPPARRSRHRA